ncbi:apolipoprotein N-acyltransferase [Shewanella avicenniae]|uniref:Apolipoprotein N-acyltransferase n=1 Tax=Shewanella avicenniae TaxID=2814294 RepID=A0ABX7QXM8_9GAMM|nr:apolipoprotein N-acyltransferase [Shewanella avicenniae]QSX35405.1 apolipoprotein N-acyltransferase [Shewanella avicenniae]
MFALGALTALSFAPYNIWPLLPVALAVAMWCGEKLPLSATKLWWWFGFGSFATGISWVHVSMVRYGELPLAVAILLMALLCAYLALFPALAGWCYSKLKSPKAPLWNLCFLFPALWVIAEWARGWVLTGFPWLWLGYSQAEGPLRPLAADIGTLGISFIVVSVAGALCLLALKRFFSLPIWLLVLAVGVFITPYYNPIKRNGETVNVALVQGNIPQSMKWDPEALWPTLLKYIDLTRPHFADSDIVIWPEAAVPSLELDTQEFLDNSNRAANLNNSAIITGIPGLEHGNFYNALIVLGNAGKKQQAAGDYQLHSNNRYRKHHLLPVGEFVPFQSLLRPIAPFFNLPMSSFSEGDYIQDNLRAAGYHLAPAICYEIAFPEQLRDNVRSDTDMLLTVSNDAWFGESNGPLQHMQIAQMRAVELGRPLLRGTNNGVTAVVDEHGNITDKLPQFEQGVLTSKVALVEGVTLFHRFGQWPILLLTALILLLALLRRKMKI